MRDDFRQMGQKIEQDRKEVSAKLQKAREEVEKYSSLYEEEKRARGLVESSLRAELDKTGQLFDQRLQEDSEQRARL